MMMRKLPNGNTRSLSVSVVLLLFLSGASHAQNQIMGGMQFVGASKVEKTSGVWIDGQYVGYLGELKGSKSVLLLPGLHDISVRQSGYKDFDQSVVAEPGETKVIRVKMERDFRSQFPGVTAEVKIHVNPDRAAVFVDDAFVGHVHEFGGAGRALLLSPGKHQIKVALPGYQTFETEISLAANQKFEIKTDLLKASITLAGPLIKQK